MDKKLYRRINKPTLFSFINISFEQTKFLIVRWKDVVMRVTNIILAHRHDENTFLKAFYSVIFQRAKIHSNTVVKKDTTMFCVKSKNAVGYKIHMTRFNL